jgi:hypothetical protein
MIAELLWKINKEIISIPLLFRTSFFWSQASPPWLVS